MESLKSSTQSFDGNNPAVKWRRIDRCIGRCRQREVSGPKPNGKSEAYGEGHFISPSRDTQGLGPQEHSNRRSDDSRPSASFGFGTENPMEGKFVYQMTQTPTEIIGHAFG